MKKIDSPQLTGVKPDDYLSFSNLILSMKIDTRIITLSNGYLKENKINTGQQYIKYMNYHSI